MAELKELFEMATKHVEPDQDSLREQQRLQDRSSRNRRIGAFIAVAATLVVAIVVVVSVWPKGSPSSVVNAPEPAPLNGYYLLATDGGSPVLIPGPEGSSWYRPSPDGERIAFVQPDAGGVDQIFSMKPDGSDVTQLTSGRRAAVEPAWSSDGSRIAFSGETGGGRELFILDPSGRTRRLTTLQSSGDAWQPTWSPDDSTIAFVINAAVPTVRIATIDVESGRMDASVIPVAFSPDWAPNGERLTYTAGPVASDRASVANADGSRRRELTDLFSSWPFWSPDGTKIAYGVEDPGAWGLYIQDVVSGDTRLISSEVCMEGWVNDATLLVTTTCD
jgi:Tol biopolymer transport system component